MSVVPMQEILKPVFERKYGVAAFNIVDDLSTLFDFDFLFDNLIVMMLPPSG